jgi:hypothetical protein
MPVNIHQKSLSDSDFTMNKLLLAMSISAALGTVSIEATAAPVDLTTWSALGDTLVSGTTAKLSTAFSDESPLAGVALDINVLEPQLGAAPGTLGLNVYEGSALAQSFNFAANTSLSFNWTLGTGAFDADFADLAFVLVDGTELFTLASVAATELTGVFNYSFTAGAHTLAFGVLDVNDYTGVSTLNVSNVNVTTNAVPEPGSLALMLAGLGLLSLRAKRRN